jgi:hypothetical protein
MDGRVLARAVHLREPDFDRVARLDRGDEGVDHQSRSSRQSIQEYTGFFTPGIVVIFLPGLFWNRATEAGAGTRKKCCSRRIEPSARITYSCTHRGTFVGSGY